MSSKENFNVTEGPLLGKIVKFSLPIMAAGMLQLGFNMMDSMIVGRFDGSLALAGVGSTTTLINLLVNGFIGLSVGSTVVISQSIGSKDYKRAGRYAHASVAIALLIGVIIAILGLFIAEPALRLMSVPKDVLPLSKIYLQIYFAGAPAMLFYNFGSAIMRTIGDTKRPMVYLGVGGVINVCLNLLLVVVFKLSVAGVAIATVASNIVSALLVLRDLLKTDTCCRIYIRKIGFTAKELGKICAVGLPACIQSSTFSISNLIMQSSINKFGAAAIAGNSASITIEGLQTVAIDSFMQCAITFVGQNYGAKKPGRILKSWLLCLGCAFVVDALFISVMIPLRYAAIGLFINNDAEAVRYASTRYVVLCSAHIIAAVMNITVGSLRGMGKSLMPMIQSIFFVCVLRIIYVYTYFKSHCTYMSLIAIYPITWFLAAAVLVCMMVYYYKKLKKQEKIGVTL